MLLCCDCHAAPGPISAACSRPVCPFVSVGPFAPPTAHPACGSFLLPPETMAASDARGGKGKTDVAGPFTEITVWRRLFFFSFFFLFFSCFFFFFLFLFVRMRADNHAQRNEQLPFVSVPLPRLKLPAPRLKQPQVSLSRCTGSHRLAVTTGKAEEEFQECRLFERQTQYAFHNFCCKCSVICLP